MSLNSSSWWCVLDATLYDKVCQWPATGQWFSMGTPVSATNKTDNYDIAETLLKVALNTITLILTLKRFFNKETEIFQKC